MRKEDTEVLILGMPSSGLSFISITLSLVINSNGASVDAGGLVRRLMQ